MSTKIPRDPHNDYTPEIAATRRAFATTHTGAPLPTLLGRHLGSSVRGLMRPRS